jgi:hypothetical protein
VKKEVYIKYQQKMCHGGPRGFEAYADPAPVHLPINLFQYKLFTKRLAIEPKGGS